MVQPVARCQNTGFSAPASDLNSLAVDAANFNASYDNSFKDNRRKQYKRSRDSKRMSKTKQSKKYETSRSEIIFKLEKLRKSCGNKNTDEINDLVDKLQALKKPNHFLQAHSLYDDAIDGFESIITKLNVFVDSLMVLSDQVSQETVKIVSQIVTTIFNIIQCPTWKSFTVNLTNLLIQYVPKDTVDYIVEYAKQLFGILVAHDGDENSDNEPFFRKFFGVIDRVANNELWEKVSEPIVTGKPNNCLAYSTI